MFKGPVETIQGPDVFLDIFRLSLTDRDFIRGVEVLRAIRQRSTR